MNRIIGLAIILMYFGSHHIANVIYPTDNVKYFDVKVIIYSLLIPLSLTYNKVNKGVVGLFESTFISIIITNIINLLIFQERAYTVGDIVIIPTILILEYAKFHKTNFREYLGNFGGDSSINHIDNKEEE
jgi:hypothetical protein